MDINIKTNHNLIGTKMKQCHLTRDREAIDTNIILTLYKQVVYIYQGKKDSTEKKVNKDHQLFLSLSEVDVTLQTLEDYFPCHRITKH